MKQAEQRAEILSPAGGYDSLTAAVRCGADAVYFGAGAFNARARDKGFCPEDLPKIAAYCKGRGVRTYLTLNTLIYDSEYGAAMELVRAACEAGIDALILQDLGLIRQIRRQTPDMVLHASTQMSVHTPSGLRFLYEMGIRRVVLARELSRDEIREIVEQARQLGVETEVFVHGAHCMSVSGQCSLSAALGGRSGNRGECAQPCRLPFASAGNSRALSLKDMCLLEHIPELVAMGLDSLKIEGRLKRPEYVAAATLAYRKAVDGQEVEEELRRNLEQVFSRGGFTDGYYTGRRSAAMFGIRSEADKDASERVLSKIRDYYRRERSSVPVDMRLTAEPDRPLELAITDGRHTVTVTGPPLAQNYEPMVPGKEQERILSALGKTGGTPFYLRHFESTLYPGISVPGPAAGALRRQGLEELLKLREVPVPVPFLSGFEDSLPSSRRNPSGKPEFWAAFRDSSQYSPEMELDRVFLPWDSPDSCFQSGTRTAIGALLPRGMFGMDETLRARLSRLYALGVRDALCGNLGAVQLALEAGMRPHFGPGMNLFGEQALEAAEEMGAASGILSAEVPAAGRKFAGSPIPVGAPAYGHLPLMLLRCCPLKSGNRRNCGDCAGSGTLTDRKGEMFSVACDGGCSELFNPHVLWMADRMESLSGFDFILFAFTSETPRRCGEVIRAYRQGGPPPSGFTRLK